MARTPVHMFGMEYRRDEYLALLANGVYDVNAQDADGKTQPHYARPTTASGDHLGTARRRRCPNIAEIHYGHTPLVTAIFWVNETGGAVENMLAKGADPTIADHKGFPPLGLARGTNKPANQRLLLVIEEAAKKFTH